MSLAISSALATASVASADSPAANATTQQVRPVEQQPTNNDPYQVTLTVAEQVYNLYNQGQRVSEIAVSLSLPLSTVNNYLGMPQSGG